MRERLGDEGKARRRVITTRQGKFAEMMKKGNAPLRTK
jgi:hypothetical protein